MKHRTQCGMRNAECGMNPHRSALLRIPHSEFRILAGFLCAFTLLGAGEAAWAFGFGVEPAKVEVSVPAGKRRGQTLTVKNAKPDAPVHLTVYVRDVVFLPDGTHEFPPAGSTDWSCAGWVSFVPKELDIPANASQEVRVSVAVPEGATGGHYAMIFFETGPSYAEQGIGVNFRIGALVEAVVPGTERYDAKLRDLSFVPRNGAVAALFNNGNLLIRPSGLIKVFDGSGKKVRQVPFNPNTLGVLPKTLRTFSVEFEEPLPDGTYQLKAEVDYGARTIIVGERSFHVP